MGGGAAGSPRVLHARASQRCPRGWRAGGNDAPRAPRGAGGGAKPAEAARDARARDPALASRSPGRAACGVTLAFRPARPRARAPRPGRPDASLARATDAGGFSLCPRGGSATEGGAAALACAFRSGVALGDLIAALSRDAEGVAGLSRRPRTAAGARANVALALARLRARRGFDLRALLESDALVAGCPAAAVTVLEAVRAAFARA